MIQPRLNTFFLVALIAGALLACGSLVPISSPPATSESSQPEAATLEATPTASPQSIAPPPTAADIAAFPGAEGFGAIATGGRGGRVIYVTTLDADPNGEVEGSLNWALRQEGPRYILFKVSGVINGPAYIRRGDVTIAGQTSPGGIITRGLICDDHYEDNDCRNLVIRHIRSRPALQIDNQEGVLDDALRLDGVDTAIIDHGSFANAVDEAIQISWSQNITIQNTLLAETVGEHFDRGGMLINYSHSTHPQDNLTIIRNMWHRIGGRTPEIICELSSIPDGPPESPSDCAAHPLNIEVSNNLLWDVGNPVWYGPLVDPGGDLSFGLFSLNLNYVSNYALVRPDYTHGLLLAEFINHSNNSLHLSGNQVNLYPNYSDYQLVYCCNDFNLYNPNTETGVASRRDARHDFPAIAYLPADQLLQYTIGNVGAFPRDPMDTRYISSLITNRFDPAPLDVAAAADALSLSFDPANPPPAPLDSDADGMPDDWEAANGLNPNVPEHNGVDLSAKFTSVEGYTNLECYLNWLSDQLVIGTGAP